MSNKDEKNEKELEVGEMKPHCACAERVPPVACIACTDHTIVHTTHAQSHIVTALISANPQEKSRASYSDKVSVSDKIRQFRIISLTKKPF